MYKNQIFAIRFPEIMEKILFYAKS